MNRAIALVVADTNVPLGTPAIIVGITGTARKHARRSPRGKVVRQVERRHAKERVSKGFKDFYNIFCNSALSSFIVIIYIPQNYLKPSNYMYM